MCLLVLRLAPVAFVPVALVAGSAPATRRPPPDARDAAAGNAPDEHAQLTFGGENAEAYFSFDGKRLTFQSTRGSHGCDQIYTMKIDGSDRSSSAAARAARRAASTTRTASICLRVHASGRRRVPAGAEQEKGYVWPIYDTYDIFRTDPDGSNLVRLTNTPGYDAEATIAKDGRIVFTSVRDGDMDIYSMNGDGSDVRRLTNLPGPDGGPFFSPDGSKIVFRGRHPEAGTELDDYFALLKKALWRPAALDVFVMNRDGSNLRQVTNLGGANWAPFFTPDGKKIIFASNMKDPRGGNFDLYLINLDGTGLEQITFSETFDGFPMFSPDGKKLVFASNRHAQRAPTRTCSSRTGRIEARMEADSP